jgi:hypothetical protein
VTRQPLTSADGVVGTPIDFDVASKVEGNESQVSWKDFVVPPWRKIFRLSQFQNIFNSMSYLLITYSIYSFIL